MVFDIKTFLTDNLSNAVKGLSDVAHSWISTNKDKMLDEAAQKEFELKVQQFAADTNQKLIDAANNADENEQKELTNRLQIDMASDSWLSKNIRPLTLAFFLSTNFLLIILSSSIKTFIINDEWITLLKESLLLVLAFYFGGRTLEKVKQMKK